MRKEIIRTDSTWIKKRVSGAIIDYVYGLRDGTNIHGHRVTNESEVIFQRDISGAYLVTSGVRVVLVEV